MLSDKNEPNMPIYIYSMENSIYSGGQEKWDVESGGIRISR